MKQKILVIGASGKVGSEVARILKSEGHQVRTTTSKKEKTSASNHYLNLVTGEGISDAFKGIDRAFFLSPAGYADQYKIVSPLIQEASKQGLKKVVLMSAFGADANEAAPLRKAELLLEKSGLSYNVIRPNWFMQNFHTFWVSGIKSASKIFLPAGAAKTSFIDTRDISAVAAKLLISDEMKNRSFNLTGPEALDHHQVASALSEVIGRRITYQEITPEEFKKGLLGAGLPEDYANFLVMIIGFVKAGYNATVTSEVRNILGRDPISFQQYAKDHRSNYL